MFLLKIWCSNRLLVCHVKILYYKSYKFVTCHTPGSLQGTCSTCWRGRELQSICTLSPSSCCGPANLYSCLYLSTKELTIKITMIENKKTHLRSNSMGGHEGNRLPGCQVEVFFQIPQHLTIKNHDGDLVKGRLWWWFFVKPGLLCPMDCYDFLYVFLRSQNQSPKKISYQSRWLLIKLDEKIKSFAIKLEVKSGSCCVLETPSVLDQAHSPLVLSADNEGNSFRVSTSKYFFLNTFDSPDM